MGDEKSLPINVDLGASAKLEIKGEIPSSSMGRLFDALTDAIRPFTEARGLRADQIRLQREDVLIEIARRARLRLEEEGEVAQAIPLKTMVPLLEKASLEDPTDEEMIQRWADLLAAEASNPGENRRWHIDTLASIDGWQAHLLEEISAREPARSFFEIQNFTREAAIEEFMLTVNDAARVPKSDVVAVLEKLRGFTLFFDGADIPNANEFELKDFDEAPALLQLDALGLVWVQATSFVAGDERSFVFNAQLTPLGHSFVSLFKSSDVE
ncbi:hypothetical protein [Rhizobium sp. L1K21]|uniref:Abi-alpha family protein n=1 Tax=Rhizobium sp. L1K21 TaxID=2954933 RepID=UPI0020926F8F|nr:hypothetical protein [Rhizobium sp. L1K21]MCO6187206.1 hypothetical protein [Rhizobium sp. L1K21]